MTKTCVRCKQEKDSSDFTPNAKAKDGLQYACRECRRKSGKDYKSSDQGRATVAAWRHSNPKKTMLYAARRRAKRDGVQCTITEEDIVIPKLCPILGIELKSGNGTKGPSPSAPTLDRIQPKIGYVPMNIQVISHKANAMKNNATPQELYLFAKWVLSGMPGFHFYGDD